MSETEALAKIREFMRVAAKGEGPRNLIPGVLAILDAVSVDPVPPLPTEPYTVIRVTWKDGSFAGEQQVLTLDDDGSWWGGPDLRDHITGFKVLAEPVHLLDGDPARTEATFVSEYRRGYWQGAKDALDRVSQEAERFIPRGNIISAANAVAREFKVR